MEIIDYSLLLGYLKNSEEIKDKLRSGDIKDFSGLYFDE